MVADPAEKPSHVQLPLLRWHLLPAFGMLMVDAESALAWFLLANKTNAILEFQNGSPLVLFQTVFLECRFGWCIYHGWLLWRP